ncbi:MAG: tyrosine-type recombinase/integrase [Deltaproteobacteria bacterium]|nr:tyrosine-type recombinase/integrase [Deltaproteobacteria bacterium]
MKDREDDVLPFHREEWKIFLPCIRKWFQPYFQFAVQTGLMPSEQIALRETDWNRRENILKIRRGITPWGITPLKNKYRRRDLRLNRHMTETLEKQLSQKKNTRVDNECIFVNPDGSLLNRHSLYHLLWVPALKKSGLAHRKMYNTRHTWACWALAAGEDINWVARWMGHRDITMVIRNYANWIPNLTGRDGSRLAEIHKTVFE